MRQEHRRGTDLAPGALRGVVYLALAAALAGCGALNWVKTRFTGELSAAPPAAAAPPASAAAPARSDDIADAVPKVEPLHPTANRWYGAAGRMYRPITDDREFKDRGRAAVLGAAYEGKATAGGEPFAAQSMSAAHPTLPIPSYARVTNLRNGRSAIVRVVDRGAFNRGEAIALSAAAAQKLQLAGNDEVEVERLTPQMIAKMTPPAPPAAAPQPLAPPEPPRPVAEVAPTTAPPATTPGRGSAVPTATVTAATSSQPRVPVAPSAAPTASASDAPPAPPATSAGGAPKTNPKLVPKNIPGAAPSGSAR
ncbi:MAG: hypothetical protein NZL99_00195 [Burkholderiaceae bacterium]|nr:hypothetical protein [Burkholderiaceae bacterium]